MFKKTLMAGAAAAALAVPSVAFTADAAPASPHTFTANVGLFSQYIFRGLTQTNEKPAIQGGFDYAYNFGAASVYVGTWNSNVSWLEDPQRFGFQQYNSSSLESDWYIGVKGNIGASDFTYDVGYLYYWYPGTVAPGGAKGNTGEIYGALGWKWFTAKYSYVVTSKAFTVLDAEGTWYLDLSASYPVGDTGLTLIAHWGMQEFDGSDNRLLGASNDSVYSYKDWKIGATYDLGKATDVLKGTTIGAYYTDTSSASRAGYGTPPVGVYPKTISGDHFTVYLQKTF